jgi:hypothetical protein
MDTHQKIKKTESGSSEFKQEIGVAGGVVVYLN